MGGKEHDGSRDTGSLSVAKCASLPMTDDVSALKRTFGCFPSGVAAVCANSPTGPVGMLISSFTSVSVDPPLVSICIMDGSRTWSLLSAAPRLGVSFLGQDQQELCRRFTSPAQDRFIGVDIICTHEGAVLLPAATAWLDCSVHREVPAGDHTIVLLRIEGQQARPAASPLVFYGSRFHRLSA